MSADTARLVRLAKDWDDADVLRQTPGVRGVWGDITFTYDDVYECDYVLVLNKPLVPFETRCPPANVWAVICEPPIRFWERLHDGPTGARRVYTSDTRRTSRRYVHSQPALPWLVDRDYDFLKACPTPRKTGDLSWVCSNNKIFPGHKKRMDFLDRLRNSVEFDLFGWGIKEIADKWDGLAPYRYSLAVENHSGPYYWTEKLADCFLSWTMPIYYGCTNVTDYFPAEAMMRIDIEAPDVVNQVNEVIHSDLWERSLPALAEARRRVLDEHQVIAYISEEIRKHEGKHGCNRAYRRKVRVTPEPGDWYRKLSGRIRRPLGRIKRVLEEC